jgi:hypothetical protein
MNMKIKSVYGWSLNIKIDENNTIDDLKKIIILRMGRIDNDEVYRDKKFIRLVSDGKLLKNNIFIKEINKDIIYLVLKSKVNNEVLSICNNCKDPLCGYEQKIVN